MFSVYVALFTRARRYSNEILLFLLARSATHAEGVTLFCPLSTAHPLFPYPSSLTQCISLGEAEAEDKKPKAAKAAKYILLFMGFYIIIIRYIIV